MKFGAVVSPSPTAIIRQKRREQKAVEWKIARNPITAMCLRNLRGFCHCRFAAVHEGD